MYSKQQARFVAQNMLKDAGRLDGSHNRRFSIMDYMKLLKPLYEKETDMFKREKLAETIDSLALYL